MLPQASPRGTAPPQRPQSDDLQKEGEPETGLGREREGCRSHTCRISSGEGMWLNSRQRPLLAS